MNSMVYSYSYLDAGSPYLDGNLISKYFLVFLPNKYHTFD